MKKALIIMALFVLLVITGCNEAAKKDFSPYAGQETRDIKSLSPQDIEGLLAGEGIPFGGMAKPAELNNHPGPRHVLDAAEELSLTEVQREKIRSIYSSMKEEAIKLGEQIIKVERVLDESFNNKSISNKGLEDLLEKSADIYAELRYVHLSAHLEIGGILSQEQIKKYNEIRGYASENPCENIPEGHPPEIWKQHYNCK